MGITMGQEIHIERKMGQHSCTVHITDTAVGVSTPLSDYMEMLLEEMGSPATVMTQAGLRKKMLEAAESLNLKLKSQVTPWASLVKR
jgi:hypothetical protein